MESALRYDVPPGTCLIETFGWYPGLRHVDLHLARLRDSARTLGFPLDTGRDRALMQQKGDKPLRCRLTLSANGEMQVTTTALPASRTRWRVAIAPIRLHADDPWLAVKSTQRALYDQMRADLPKGVDEWLFLNERDEVAEGTITTLFVEMPDGHRLTPARASGVLPGVLRAHLLASGWQEARLHLADLRRARQIWVGNALRGLVRADVTLSYTLPVS